MPRTKASKAPKVPGKAKAKKGSGKSEYFGANSSVLTRIGATTGYESTASAPATPTASVPPSGNSFTPVNAGSAAAPAVPPANLDNKVSFPKVNFFIGDTTPSSHSDSESDGAAAPSVEPAAPSANADLPNAEADPNDNDLDFVNADSDLGEDDPEVLGADVDLDDDDLEIV